MENRILTCIVCPRGCTLEVSFGEGGEIVGITGNACKRGIAYATDECTHPRRTVTSTVRCEGGGILSVKTEKTVPRELVFEVMKKINSVKTPDTTRIGDVIIYNVCDTGVNVVATSNGPFEK